MAATFRDILRPMDVYARLGSWLHSFFYRVPEHWDLKEQKERLDRLKWAAETLNRVADRCHGLGIGCVLENKLPHLLFAQTSDLLWILSTMDTVDVGVCLDTGHANVSGDIYSVMHKLGQHLRMIHAHDNHGNGR
jgi:sugar phosphate isomerase/epimerase